MAGILDYPWYQGKGHEFKGDLWFFIWEIFMFCLLPCVGPARAQHGQVGITPEKMGGAGVS